MKLKTVNDLIVVADDYMTSVLEKNGCWEPNITKFLTKLFNKNPLYTFIDVGACYGYYSALYERLTGFGGHAIEANPITFSMCLKHNLKKTHCINAFVTTKDWSPPFSICLNNIGGSGLNPTGNIKIKGIKLSELPVVDVYKIDVEGGEHEVLHSFGDHIPPQVKHIILEVTPVFSKDNVLDCLNFLMGEGFTLFDLGLYERGSLSIDYPITKLNIGVLLNRRQSNVWATRNSGSI